MVRAEEALKAFPKEHAAINLRDQAKVKRRQQLAALALSEARSGDIVLIAGKGHESYQETNGVRRPFSDVAVARAALARRRS